ncbi:S9 family peptidase [Thalassotalea litorea]|uniref:S9 family peptidase n=2 Tax=Thalassotalea litorea TaxID=2020715 RepID=A0A5R9IK58_9GAMM|nr:S9 family peptidase [Thalassotalea litorea]TLU61677.1 S9 family peptidase [Thalassotalea litorea]
MNKAVSGILMLMLSTTSNAEQSQTQEQVSTATKVESQPLTIERIYSAPSLSGEKSKNLQYFPDGTKVSYLKAKQEDQNRYDLWQYNIADNEHTLLVDSNSIFSGKEELSDEEKARRERQRVYGSGIMEYVISPNGDSIVFPINGDLYLYNLEQQNAIQLTQDEDWETDIKFSPKGKYVSYIKQQNIYLIDVSSPNKKQIALTKDGKGTVKNGMAEFVAQEEMDRMSGYWWSPNEKHLAYIQVDEAGVDIAIRNEIYAEEVKLFEQRYPATGTNNVTVKLKSVQISNRKVKNFPLGDEQDIYLPRVKWLPDSKGLSYQWQSRDQQTLKLRFHQLKSRVGTTVITETSDHWINLNQDLQFLKESRQFIWASEQDGFKHLYLYNYEGEQIAQLTKGKWVVDELVAVDENQGWVYFTGRADTPLEKHLYKVTLDGKSPEHVTRISKRSGFHKIRFAKDQQTYLDNYSSISTAPQLSLHKADGERMTYLLENALDANHPVAPYLDALVTPKFGTLKSDDGEVDLYYKLYTPKNLKPGKKYPVIVHVYGGPHAQRVTNQWSGADMIQYMVSQGYIVYQLDNRGSNYRGTAFEFPIYKKLGDVELSDQITGVKHLRTLPFVDPERIGIYGHSYGGYMALMALFKAPEYFQAGVSGAPVTDWLLYDTHYTERYLGHPQSNADGYEQSSVFPYVEGFAGKLFLYHGMADDNVLFTNTTKLIKTLQDNNKMFDLMTYPGSKHSMRGKPVKTHLNNAIMRFFNDNFKPEQ